ncbi:MAG: acetolactate synthase AlsS [Phycisphaerales bacterium]|nr:acetolactate synthase AlsS [Phycisphaerales bacterium]
MFSKSFQGLNVAELLVRCLESQGVTHVFGIPGAKIDPVFEALADAGPELVVCRHEQNAAFIAGGIGRMTGRPGVCVATSGPGVTNLATGLVTANTEGQPVVAFSGAVPTNMENLETHQSLDNVNLLRPVTKHSVSLRSPGSVGLTVSNAFRAALEGRPGASYVSLPYDLLLQKASEEPPSKLLEIQYGPADTNAIEEVAGHLSAAEHPVILVGRGGSEPQAVEAIRRLLRKSRIPVVITYEAAGVITPDLADIFCGRVGLFRNQPGDKLLAEADVIMTVGFDEVEYDPEIWSPHDDATLIHAARIPAQIRSSYMPDVELIGDIAATLEVMGPLLSMKGSPSDHSIVQNVLGEYKAFVKHDPVDSGSGIHPLQFINALHEIVDDQTTIACDVGSVYIWMSRYFLGGDANRLLFSNGQQTLGVALPWAIAATIARPDDQVISMSGDGGFLFSAMELETAVRLGSNFVHVVWRDGSYDMVGIQQELKYGRRFGDTFGEPDIVKFAEAFGASGMRIQKPGDIEAVLREGLATPGPVLVDMPVDYASNLKLCETMNARSQH